MANRGKRARKPRHNSWTADRRAVFLRALTESANVSWSARRAGKHPSTAYDLRQRDPAFRRAWEEALDASMDELFASLLNRAKHGSTQTFTGEDGRVRTVHSYSDGMALRLLAMYRPDLHGRLVQARAAAEAPAAFPAIGLEALSGVDAILARAVPRQDE